jgi:hypothetical protein
MLRFGERRRGGWRLSRASRRLIVAGNNFAKGRRRCQRRCPAGHAGGEHDAEDEMHIDRGDDPETVETVEAMAVAEAMETTKTAQADLTDLKSLPIACTLSPGDLRMRLDAIRTLTREALVSHERDGLDLTLHYVPAAEDRVRAMVAAEQHCCAFLRFDISRGADGVHVRIHAPEDARDAADELFAHFT